MLEHRHAGETMLLRFFVAPVIGRFVAGAVKDVGISVTPERFLDSNVIVREEMARYVEHRQCVGSPYARGGIDVDRKLRLHRRVPRSKSDGGCVRWTQAP